MIIMHFILKNKKIIFLNYKLKCSIGKRGIIKNKKEGDKCTPKGTYEFKTVFYRKDKVPFLKTGLKKIIIRKNMGWCDDSNSNQYNKLVKFPFKNSAEKLYRKDNSYDIIITLNHNSRPIIKNKGSAIFFHVSKNNYSPTQGCVALSKRDIKILLLYCKKNNKVIIV